MMRIVLLLSALVAGCGDDDGPSSSRDDGELGGHCYPNGTCNVGLYCSAGLCATTDAAVVDGPQNDAPSFVCADDSSLEPNESIATAWVTPVDTIKNFPLSSLAICPAGDKDTYSISLTVANENLEVIVAYSAGGPAIQAAILNSGGIALANATATGTPNQLRAYTPNMPTGIYYAMVNAPATERNNYTLTINVTGP